MGKPYIKMAAELTPKGTVSSNPFWMPGQSLGANLNPGYEDRSDEIRGLQDPVAGYPNSYEPDWSHKLRAYPNLLGLFLYLWAGDITTTAGNGVITDPDGTVVPTGAFRHVFSFKQGLVPRTGKIDAGDDYDKGPHWTMQGAALESLKIAGKKGALGLDMKGKTLGMDRNRRVFTSAFATGVITCAGHAITIGMPLTFYGADLPAPLVQGTTYYGATPIVPGTSLKVSATPGGDAVTLTDDGTGINYLESAELTPVEPSLSLFPWGAGQILLTWLSGTATTEDFDLEFLQKLWWGNDFSEASLYPTAVELDDDYRQVKGNMSKRSLDRDDYDAIKNATTFAAVAKYVSAQDVTPATPIGYTPKLWVDMPACVYEKGDPADIENKPRRSMKMDFKATYDSVTGRAVLVTLVNGIPSYNTFA